MKHLVFSVFDSKAKAYLPPFFMHNEDMAIRIFKDCVNSGDHQFGKHPSDYTLFCLGEFLDHEGIINFSGPHSVGNGVEYLEFDEKVTEGMTARNGNGKVVEEMYEEID